MTLTLFEFPEVQTKPAVTLTAYERAMSPKTEQDIQNLIYPLGGGYPAQIHFHEDGGHGWLQVQISLLKRLNIGPKITEYSYRDKTYAYLEEDQDLTTFMTSLGIEGGSELNKMFWANCPRDYAEESPIRRKARY